MASNRFEYTVGAMDKARIVELPSYHVVKLRYEGRPPPDPALVEHWKRFNHLVSRSKLRSHVDDLQSIGYAPPIPYAGQPFVYETCLPVAPDFAAEGLDELEVGEVPGGRFVLSAGLITELPALLAAARRYAMSHGLAIERGRIELYRPIPPGTDITPVHVGYRIHH
jgi:hypothetical protein